MKNPKIVKGRTEDLLNQMDGVQTEESVDATGPQTSVTDYNFDILKQHYAGTDFESEANSLCDVVSSFSMKNNGLQSLVPIVMKIKDILKGEDGNIVSGFEPYDDFIVKFTELVNQGIVNKSNSPEPTQPVLNENKDLPNVKQAQAKLIELEQYLDGMNLSKREKWQDYLATARQQAAVGDDKFNATPELGQDDMEYIQESSRQKEQRDSAKDALLEGFMGV